MIMCVTIVFDRLIFWPWSWLLNKVCGGVVDGGEIKQASEQSFVLIVKIIIALY